MHALEQALWIGGVGLSAALVAKLLFARLFRVYVWFTVFLSFEIARSLVLLPFRPTSKVYAWVFVLTQPVTWILYILVVLELYGIALRSYRGVTTLSRWVISGALGLSVAVSALTLWADLSHPTGPPVLVYYSVVERGLIFSLALFLLFITLFLAWFPLAISRNIRLHSATFSVYFLATTMALFVRNVAGYSTSSSVDAILMLIALVCFCLWLVGLSRCGEEKTAARHRWRPDDETKLLERLDALNSAVLKPTRW